VDRPATTTRHVLTRSVLALGLKGTIVAAGFGMQIVLARTLGPEGLGVYATFLSIVTVLSITGGFGMPLAAIRFIPVYAAAGQAARLRGFVRTAQGLVVATSLPVAAVFCAVFLAVPALRDQAGLAVAAAAIIPAFGLATLVAGMLQAVGQPLRAELLSGLARTLLVAVLVLASGWLGLASPVVALWLTALAALVTWAAALPVLRRAMPVPPAGPRALDERRAWLDAGLAFVLAMAALSLIERLDTILLGTLVGAEAAGIYSVSSRLALTVALASTSVLTLLAPTLAREAAAGDRAGLQRSVAVATALMLTLALGIAVVMAAALPWLLPAFGPGFGTAATPLVILLGGQVAVAACGPGGGLLALAGRNRAVVASAFGAVILDIVLCLVLVPVFGPEGAAAATVGTLLAQAVAQAFIVRRIMGVDPTVLGAVRLAWGSFGPRKRHEGGG
jgi:O-antigen/teichoic acid export membrane protein